MTLVFHSFVPNQYRHGSSKSGFLLIVTLCMVFIFTVCPALVSAQNSSLIPKNKKEIDKELRFEKKERQRIVSSSIYSVTQTRYQYKFGRIDTKGTTESIVRYNGNGYIVEENTFNLIDGTLQSRKTYRYDNQGNCIEENVISDESVRKTVFRYTSLNKRSEILQYKSDGSIDKKTTSIYDENGLLLETIGYLDDGRLFLRESYLYDHQGNMAERKNSQNKVTYQYDDNGNIHTINKYSRVFLVSDSTNYVLTDRYLFTHDRNDNLISMYSFRPDSSIKTRFEYTVDKDGLLTAEKEYNADNKLMYQRNIVYNKTGNIVEETGTDRGKYFKIRNKYDVRDNRIETIVYDQINEPKYLLKYTYGRTFAAKSKQIPQKPNDSTVQTEVEVVEVEEAKAFINEEFEPLLGGKLVAPDGAYLGLIIADTVNSQSIVNTWGQYGFTESPTSIFNTSIPYGGNEGVFSPFNPTSPSPPSIYKDGKFFSYCTENENFRPRSSPKKLILYLRMLARQQ